MTDIDLEQIRRMRTIEWFDRRFIELTRRHDTYEEAYTAVEREYRKVFGAPRYSNYESYRKARAKRVKAGV